MARLIDLVLQPAAESKRSSMAVPQYPTPTRRLSAFKSSRHEDPAVARLIIIPYTQEEWRRVLADVKVLFLKRQYRQCSARCFEILEGLKIKTPEQVHPLFLIYLSFFAACSFEQTAGLLHQNSSSKLPTLQQAVSHYKNAESFIDLANSSADPASTYLTQRSHPYSVTSAASSIRSYADSVFSLPSPPASGASSVMSSPTLSYASDDTTRIHSASSSTGSTDGVTPAPLRMKKKVSFSLQIDTLGANSSPTRLEDDVLTLSPTLPDSPTLPSASSSIGTVSSYLLIQSVSRYRAHLAALQSQIRGHLDSIDAQITDFTDVRRARRSNNVILFAELQSGFEGFDREEMKKVELRARIAKLKEGGWKRERFNGERYERLCETVLKELEVTKH